MRTITTEIIINASKEKVWNVLTTFGNYKNWNDFIISIEGKPEVNTTLINKIDMQGKVQTFKPVVVIVDPLEKFEWVGKLPLGMFTGHHKFEIVSINENQVKFIHQEDFSGWLSGLLLRFIGEDTRAGFVKMNKALKATAEM